jgi:D-alanine-D-alanine ligase
LLNDLLALDELDFLEPRSHGFFMNKRKVMVAMGGNSSEREVSLKTGEAVKRALASLGHTVTAWDPASGIPENAEDWKALFFDHDVVFLALHGKFGEDGALQQKLESLRIPFTGCDSVSSALAFDKVETKKVWRAKGLLTADFVAFESPVARFPEELGLPFVVKPAREGSSVGLYFVKDPSEWTVAVDAILKLDSRGLAESRINGREITVGVLEGQPLPIVEIRPKTGVYDYANKYTAGATEYLCPAPFSAEETSSIQQIAHQAFDAVGARDYARVDLMISESGAPALLEINTLPGMTETSLLPKAAAAAGIGFESLCQRMVDMACNR